MNTVTQSLAEFVMSTDRESLPAWSIHEAKRTLLNMLAISLSASKSDGASIILDWAREECATEHASVIGANLKTSMSTAALVNGFLCHLQDYDDTHFPTILHPTAPVWPSVLALSERLGISGYDTLSAFVLGAETACRVAISVHPWHYDQGWHIIYMVGVGFLCVVVRREIPLGGKADRSTVHLYPIRVISGMIPELSRSGTGLNREDYHGGHHDR